MSQLLNPTDDRQENPADFHEPVKKRYIAEISLWFEFEATANELNTFKENLEVLAEALEEGCTDHAGHSFNNGPLHDFSGAKEALKNDCGKIIDQDLNIHEEKE